MHDNRRRLITKKLPKWLRWPNENIHRTWYNFIIIFYEYVHIVTKCNTCNIWTNLFNRCNSIYFSWCIGILEKGLFAGGMSKLFQETFCSFLILHIQVSHFLGIKSSLFICVESYCMYCKINLCNFVPKNNF